MSFADRTLTCRDCGASFTFTASEQEFYASKGFANDPSRCPNCRAARRAQRGGSGLSDRGSGGARFERGPREMHTVVCAECGTETQVPFVPRGDRPVYCSSCFDKIRGRR